MHQRMYTFDIITETNDSGRTNLYSINLETGKTPYYCEASGDADITIRGGNELGPIIATVKLCREKEGITEIEFSQGNNIVQLKHGHHNLPHIHSQTTFVYNSKIYGWEGHSELYQKKSDGSELIATFYAGLDPDKVGTMEVVYNGEEMSEMAIITVMILLKRAEKGLESINAS